MRRRMAFLVLVLFVAALGSSGSAAGKPNTWWTSLGGSPDHANQVTAAFGKLQYAWSLDGLGVSGSQPLYVNGTIYHLTEKGLFQIPVNDRGEIPDSWSASPIVGSDVNVTLKGAGPNPTTSGMTYAEVGPDRKPVIYFGTGGNQICVYVIDKGRNCRPLEGDNPIVSTPLVWESQDVVIMGDKSGTLWAVKGLSGSQAIAVTHPVTAKGQPTWITSSATAVWQDETHMDFLWSAYVEGSAGPAIVGRARVSLDPDGNPSLQVMHEDETGEPESGVPGVLWSTLLNKGNGIADGFSYDASSRLAFVNDLTGRAYRLQVDNPTLNRTSDPSGTHFANDLASFDSDTVYFTMRNTGIATSDYKTPGGIVAINKNTWDHADDKWPEIGFNQFPEADNVRAGNTPPLIWGNALLVATTGGWVLGFNKNTGQLEPFVADVPEEFHTADNGSRIQLLKPGELPFQASESYRSISGSGVKPMVSTGGTGTTLLLIGVNYKTEDSQAHGRLMAFRAVSDDPFISYRRCPTQSYVWYDAEFRVKYQTSRAGAEPFTGRMLVRWEDEQGVSGSTTFELNIQPNEQQSIPLHVQDLGPGMVTLTAEIVLPDGFTDLRTSNNVKTCQTIINPCPDCGPAEPAPVHSVLIAPH